MRLAINGFGAVGQALAHILHQRGADLDSRYGFRPRLVAVATRRTGAHYSAEGMDLADLLARMADGRGPTGAPLPSLLGLTRDHDVDVLIDATPTDVHSGGPGLAVCRHALMLHAHIVLASKGPLAVAFHELAALARQQGVSLRYEATVMAGTPVLRLAQVDLAADTIQSARGIVNGTTNFMLTQMERDGLSYDEALAQAQALGYAETDPSGDVDGWDAAAKVVILGAALFGAYWTLDDLDVHGIRGITPQAIRDAQNAGERWKLIATVTPQGGRVAPMRLPLDDPLAGVSGAHNAITYRTDLMGDVTLIGAGAGPTETAFALLSDLLAIHRGG